MRALLALVLGVTVLRPSGALPERHLSHACSILAFGDSITWGANASQNTVGFGLDTIWPVSIHLVGPRDTSYPGYLGRWLHTPVCNYGLPSELALHGRVRLHTLLGVLKPQTVIVMEGVNDLASERPTDAVLADLRVMIQDVRHHHIHPILATLSPTYFPTHDRRHFLNEQVVELNRAIRSLAHHDRITMADVEAAFRHDRRGVTLTRFGKHYDYLHPNRAGYHVMATAVLHAVKHRAG